MLAKFLLIIYIGKNLSVDTLGEYGLFVTTITISIFFLGMDFYTYNSRELIGQEKSKQLIFVRDQFVFHILVYIVVLPLLFMIFILDIIAYQYIFYFYIVLILEHISQELYRLYTTLAMPILANILLFLRMGIWVYVLIFLWIYDVDNTKNLYTVYISWIVGSLISVVLGFLYLFRVYRINNILDTKIDWHWIKRGLKVSIPFFIGTIAYKVIEFSDRYMIDTYMTKTDVGIYTFFGSIANSMQSVVFVLVIMIFYPKLIELYKDEKFDEFNLKVKRFFWEVLIYSIITMVGVIIFIYPILEYLGKQEFVENLDMLWILLGATLLLNLSFVPHYILFVKHQDLIIRNITLLGAGLNIGLNLLLIPFYGLIGAGIATLISFFIIILLKYKVIK
jgi:O-antigen/teichoic acid export membrane protein